MFVLHGHLVSLLGSFFLNTLRFEFCHQLSSSHIWRKGNRVIIRFNGFLTYPIQVLCICLLVLIEGAGCVVNHFAAVSVRICSESNLVVESSVACSQLTVNREGHLHCPLEESPPDNLRLPLRLHHCRLPDAVSMLLTRRVTELSET